MILEAKKWSRFCKTQIFDVENLKEGPWDKDGRREYIKKLNLILKNIKNFLIMQKKLSVNFLLLL